MNSSFTTMRLEELEARATHFMQEGKDSAIVALQDSLDPEEWVDCPSPIRFAIRTTIAVRRLTLYLLVVDENECADLARKLESHCMERRDEISGLDVSVLSEMDLRNLSNYGDAVAALGVLAHGAVQDLCPLRLASCAFQRRLEKAPDFVRDDAFEEHQTYEVLRRFILEDLAYVSEHLAFWEESELLDPGRSIYGRALGLTSLLLRIGAATDAVGADAIMALLLIQWYDSQIQGSFNFSIDRLVLLAYISEHVQGRYSGDPRDLIEALRPETPFRTARALTLHTA